MLDLLHCVLKSALDRRGKDRIELADAAEQTGEQLLEREHIRAECFQLLVGHSDGPPSRCFPSMSGPGKKDCRSSAARQFSTEPRNETPAVGVLRSKAGVRCVDPIPSAVLMIVAGGVPATREGHDARQFRQHSGCNITNQL